MKEDNKKNGKQLEPKSAHDIRQEFLSKSSGILDKMFGVMDDEGNSLNAQEAAVIKLMWPTVSTLITSSADRQKLDAKSTSDVIGMLREGTLSILEAKDLMSMLSIQSDIEDIKALLVKVNQLTGDGATYSG